MSHEVHTEEIQGFTVRIFIDEDAQNPFDDWECNPPLAVYAPYNRGIDEYATGYGEVNTPPTLTREQIKANLPAILELCEAPNIRELLREYPYREMAFVDCVNDAIREGVDNLGDSDRLEALCSLYAMVGMPAVLKSVHGSSQGDYAEVLAVATPEFQAECGNGSDYDWDSSLRASIQLFEDWAFGNVYGYTVEDAEGNEIDSCWGFFGDYNAPYGAMHEAEAAINWQIAKNRKSHVEQVKTWIKNRVPLHYRTLAI